MSYTVLARKWRPKRFAEVVGQQHVVQALVNSLAAGRLHHAYLFAGTRGVGKTTVARILAKALNCTDGVVAEPCGTCDACLAIDEGRFVDLLEVDAASRTRVDDTRELLDNVQYAPTHGRYKIYLIDEVHMLSNHSFNALLKTLEEPPPHVMFLLATTDPQKLPVTVLSRCLQFNLKRLTPAQIQEQLQKICAAEEIEAEPDGLKALAKGAEGSMRDALSLLDQAIAFGGGHVQREAVEAMLGTIDRFHLINLLEGLAAGDGSALMKEVAELDEQAPNYSFVLDGLMGALQRLAVIQLVGPESATDDDAALLQLTEKMSPEDVQLYYQIALQGRRDLAACADWRSAFEMTLLRMLAFRPAAADEPGRAAAAPTLKPKAKPKPKPKPRAESEPAGGPQRPRRSAVRDEGTVTPPPQAEPGLASPATPDATAWAALLGEADVRGAARQLAESCAIRERTDTRIDLVVSKDRSHLNTDQIRGRLEAALGEHLGRSLKLTVTPGTPPAPTPADQRKANETQRMRKAREAIERDPAVIGFQDTFDAVVEADTIEPIEAAKGT
ncbi:MAG: DNA polymerase III subunit gamma/tau [Gammaproteobacteria bacterium]|nr:DNA polymerase III subunit gamma/tau [Gammaproteobacteria bacterium]MDH3506724.1 DNA polymerase III subunit gamma/tau [Gammaproteobacteria bacterium]